MKKDHKVHRQDISKLPFTGETPENISLTVMWECWDFWCSIGQSDGVWDEGPAEAPLQAPTV